MIQSAKITKN